MVTKHKLDVFDRHQLKIAKDSLRMPQAVLGVMGGPSKPEARRIILKIEGKVKGTKTIKTIEG
jgi:hypothetical protein